MDTIISARQKRSKIASSIFSLYYINRFKFFSESVDLKTSHKRTKIIVIEKNTKTNSNIIYTYGYDRKTAGNSNRYLFYKCKRRLIFIFYFFVPHFSIHDDGWRGVTRMR